MSDEKKEVLEGILILIVFVIVIVSSILLFGKRGYEEYLRQYENSQDSITSYESAYYDLKKEDNNIFHIDGKMYNVDGVNFEVCDDGIILEKTLKEERSRWNMSIFVVLNGDVRDYEDLIYDYEVTICN